MDTGRKKVAKNSTRQNNFKRGVERNNTKTFHYRFIRDTWFTKTMIELDRSEAVILEMDRLASEDHSHIATEEEIDVYRGDWWSRSNVVNFDTMPMRRRPDFKKRCRLCIASRKRRIKRTMKIGRKSSSSSSWWQWQTSWWHPSSETSPRRWT